MAIKTIETIGIIGAGQMGHGIAHVCALAGIETLLLDIDPARLEAALKKIDKNLTRQVSRGRISEEDKAAALKRIGTVSSYDDQIGRASCRERV